MLVFVFTALSLLSPCLATIPRPRGVAISMASFYKPDVPFQCLDGSKQVPFEYVNDDYCDCPDGSDEPGTSACTNGKFHCTNAGYRPINILSSRVNDGICDCCDGSDEWEGNIECVNNCKELGRKMREDREKQMQLQDSGYKVKLQYMEEGKKRRAEKRAEMETLEQSKVELEALKNEVEARKIEVEGPEKEAKEKHEQAWKEVQEAKKAELDKIKAETAFYEMDENKDNRVDLVEIKAHAQFDVDNNGEVCDSEAREHLEIGEEADHVDLEHFMEKVWPNIRDFYKSPAEQEDKGDNQEIEPKGKYTEDDGYIDHEEDDDEDEFDDDDDIDDDDDEKPEDNMLEPPKATSSGVPDLVVPPTGEEENRVGENKTGEEEAMPEYDDETKQLIAVADAARKQFTDADNALRDAENAIRDLQNYLNLDYGPNEEFSALKGNCYEYTDREYTYKLCGFEKATQRPKAGGSETTLGNWGKWEGTPEDKYAAQKYENGQSCWNGPNRSVKVNMKCGLENKVTGTSEPSRCEYAFDFETPARCTEPPARASDDTHDEL
ncbi:glucosidase 2 subunit beta-like isoform X2 [Mya arenaria]|uniref:glucosidase 2 subunit beta-like isoform X2 n=1 Tax=Mya arenaria TaxID=6604 RepID=UPI0022E454A9|nr:glucosidase 2 subunit beta-like isoform X2 [Mya arenaria]